jgi:RNA polymerase sigma-70 factor (ECF subfamily)
MQPFCIDNRLYYYKAIIRKSNIKNPQSKMTVIHLHQEENEIIQLAVENNRQAQRRIYTQFSPKMLGVCRQYIKDTHQAEDVMITAFMKVFTNIKASKTKAVLRVGLDE